MKTLKITLTPDQRIQLAYAATLEIDLPDYDQVFAERDNAWRELRDIRKAINANPEESTADECQRISSQLNSAKSQLEAIRAILLPDCDTGVSLVELLQQRLNGERLTAFSEGGSAQKAFWDGFERGTMEPGGNIRANWNQYLTTKGIKL